MPGVPSGKGCNACKKQKKKCDQANPCSRCARIGIKCIGAGQQRYVFRVQTKAIEASKPTVSTLDLSSVRKDSRTNNPSSNLTSSFMKLWDAATNVSFAPSGANDQLLNSFVYAIQPSMDIRFNLGWTYGIFFYEIPQRLGTSKPLDAAAQALIAIHSETCRRLRTVSSMTLIRYSDALRVLRNCLGDPIEASRSETLCAVAILLICQSLLGVHNQNTPTHGEGAAKIIQARGYCYDPSDRLERKLLLTMRGSLLFDGIFNDKVTNMFTLEQWQRLVHNELDGTTAEGDMMRCVAQMPDIIRRGRRVRRTGEFDNKIVEQCQFGYKTIKVILQRVQTAYEEIDKSHMKEFGTAVSVYAYYHRLYAVIMIFALLSNMLLQAAITYNINPISMIAGPFPPDVSELDIETLSAEATTYSDTIYNLAAQANQYRPLGGAYMMMCLMAAWIGIDDRVRQKTIYLAIDDYQGDYVWAGLKVTESALDWMKRRIQFEDVPSYAPNGWRP